MRLTQEPCVGVKTGSVPLGKRPEGSKQHHSVGFVLTAGGRGIFLEDGHIPAPSGITYWQR